MRKVGLDLVFSYRLRVNLHAFTEGGDVRGDEESNSMTSVFEGSCYFECNTALAVCAGYVDYGFVGIPHRISQGFVKIFHVL